MRPRLLDVASQIQPGSFAGWYDTSPDCADEDTIAPKWRQSRWSVGVQYVIVLVLIIRRECKRGSHIHSDEWPAHRQLVAEGFRHTAVNHQKNNVDPATGAHTQGIERSWLDAEISILKKKRGVSLYLLQSHLDHYCWRMKRKNESDLFLAFLTGVRNSFMIPSMMTETKPFSGWILEDVSADLLVVSSAGRKGVL